MLERFSMYIDCALSRELSTRRPEHTVIEPVHAELSFCSSHNPKCTDTPQSVVELLFGAVTLQVCVLTAACTCCFVRLILTFFSLQMSSVQVFSMQVPSLLLRSRLSPHMLCLCCSWLHCLLCSPACRHIPPRLHQNYPHYLLM